jgi:hypothetical protein
MEVSTDFWHIFQMRDNMSVSLTNLVVSLLIAIVSAVVTVQLAFRRFRSERWWEKRANSYAELMEALHDFKRGILRDEAEAGSGQGPADTERIRELTERSFAARDTLEKMADTASLFIPKAESVLGTLMQDLEHAHNANYPNNYIGFLQDELSTVSRCLKLLPDIARADLGIEMGLIRRAWAAIFRRGCTRSDKILR